MDRYAVHSLDRAPPLALGSGCRREDLDFMPARHEALRQVMDLHLNAAKARQVAVGEHGDTHPDTLPRRAKLGAIGAACQLIAGRAAIRRRHHSKAAKATRPPTAMRRPLLVVVGR